MSKDVLILRGPPGQPPTILNALSSILYTKLPHSKGRDIIEVDRRIAGWASLPFVQIDAETLCRFVSKPTAPANLLVPVKLEGGEHEIFALEQILLKAEAHRDADEESGNLEPLGW